MPDELDTWEVARLAAMPAGDVAKSIQKLAEVVEGFRRQMLVGDLYNEFVQGDDATRAEVLADRVAGMSDDFLARLATFGTLLSQAARTERSKAEVRRTGSTYGSRA